MSRRISRFALALGCSLMAACHVGQRAETFGPARSPAGALGQIQTRDGRIAVELLAATDSGLIVLVRDTVLAFAPYRAIRHFSVRDFGYSYETAGNRPDEASLAQVRLVSRFPQGITPALLARLLAVCHQREAELLK